MARKVKPRSKTRSSRKAVSRELLGEILAELLAIEGNLKTSTVSFCKQRLRASNERLAELLGESEESSS